MRQIKYIVIHCTATSPDAKVESIQRYWKENLHWKSPGYHYIIKADGEVVNLAPESAVTNGVAGYNSNSVHLSYIGGIDSEGKPKDTRTSEQLESMKALVTQLHTKYPEATIQGHRDFPGVHKACPSFDVRTWIKTFL